MSDKGLKPTIVKGRVILKLKEQTAKTITTSIPTGRQSMVRSLGVPSVDSVLKKYDVKSITKLRAPSVEETVSAPGIMKPRILGEQEPTHEDFGFTRTFLVNVAPETDVKAMVEDLKQNPNVEDASVDYYARAYVIPNDTYFPDQWGLKKIKCEEAWDLSKGSENVIIAIVDTGIDSEHPDLKDKLLPGFDMVNVADVPPEDGCVWEGDIATRDNDPNDENGHGTHCAGIAAGIVDNGIGIAGVAWNCKLMPVRVMANLRCTKGSSTYVTASGIFSDIADGIIWAADNGAHVISMSLGGYVSKNDPEPEPMKSAIDYAASKGCVIVAAMGNDGANLDNEDVYNYPSKHAKILAVGAIDENGNRADFSNYGDYKQIMAPGVNIRSTYFGSRYADLDGTSMATPFAAGVAALVKSANLRLTAESIVEIMRQSSTSANQYSSEFGFGIMNAEAALKKAMGITLPGPESEIISIPLFEAEVEGALQKPGDEKVYKITTSNNFTISLDGPENADFDIYVRKGEVPTKQKYDQRGYSPNADESVIVPIQEQGEYYIMIHSYKGLGDYKIKIKGN